jgi:hypothetical protein
MQQASNWSTSETVRFASKMETGRDLLSNEEALTVGRYWAFSAQAEHASVASFARHTMELMSVGATPEILRAAQQAGVEEVGHAQLCFGLAKKYGVIAEPGPFPLPSASPSSFLDMTIGVATEGCVAEFGSCIVASFQATRAKPPAVKAALVQIAKEEAGHCVLAWRTLLWAVGKLRANANGDALLKLSQAFQKAMLEEESALLNINSGAVGQGELDKVAARVPALGLLTQQDEATARVATARGLTQLWAKSVLRGERPACPNAALLKDLDPCLNGVVSQIHQAIFYQEPIAQS